MKQIIAYHKRIHELYNINIYGFNELRETYLHRLLPVGLRNNNNKGETDSV